MISKDEIKHIAGLARIGMDERDIEKYSKELSAVLDWVEQLKKVDVEGVEPTAHITGMFDVTREDRAREFRNREEITKLFPESKDGYDKVKAVL